jgi:hypothetical protein
MSPYVPVLYRQINNIGDPELDLRRTYCTEKHDDSEVRVQVRGLRAF